MKDSYFTLLKINKLEIILSNKIKQEKKASQNTPPPKNKQIQMRYFSFTDKNEIFLWQQKILIIMKVCKL